VLIPAGEVHSCNPENDGRWSYQMLYLDPAWIEGVVGEMGALDAVVLNRLPPEVAPQQVHVRLTRLNACLFSVQADAEKEAALLVFVGELFGAMHVCRPVREQPRDAERLRRVQNVITARCAESLSLDELAHEAGMSRYHFVRAFGRVVGMTPHAWQLDRRIERARGLLEQGMSLADAALQLGFSDQSHFQRAFKQRVAATPGEYRRIVGSLQ
jgi:AraC-like DNA-binding protein